MLKVAADNVDVKQVILMGAPDEYALLDKAFVDHFLDEISWWIINN